MSDLYSSVKSLPKTGLRELGFKNDSMKEGFFKEITEDVSAVFHITGAWSYVEIHCGLRFNKINKILFDEAIKANWSREKANMFRLEILGLFREKIGDFCESSLDLGTYCPEQSQIASLDGISEIIVTLFRDLSKMHELNSALDYVFSKELYEPFGKYMIPVAAKLCNREDIWKWIINYFGIGESVEYTSLIDGIRRFN